ncbi:16S rRNA (guanine(527)-N(7))-methyltransferase RsmG [Sulfurimonas sp. HSL-1656]|uniref:16S rRNA (guanine(527)-N(7))-methyltransferase RsmG n=1 Tax=Thiomicrolovo subterrani TaxID=3131934 RepID=UPI0031F91642
MTFAQKIATLPDAPSYLASHLERYRDLLLQWNKIHNLSGYKDAATIEYYLYDALYPVTFLPPVATAMDIGTGAGFPGLILAMAQPQTHWTLVEPLQKRAGFLQFVKATLKLENVTVENCRVEALPDQRFDLITSRAVTDTGMLLNLSAPYRDAETMLLFYKGENVYNEVPEDLPYRIIETDERHYLLINPPKETACS